MQTTTFRRRYTNLNDVENILASRKRETYKLDGIRGISYDDNSSKPNFEFLVKESDEFQYGIYSNDMIKKWYLPKHAFSQLANYLGVPIRLYDFMQLGREKLDKDENQLFLDNISENLELLCQKRLKEEEESKRLKHHYITVFDDIFGNFVRRISSEIYRPYEDVNALIDTNANLEKINAEKGTNYHHRETYLSPFKLTSNFIDESQKLTLKNVGDTIKGGITLINSETKDSSYGFQALMFRLACENGMISEFKDPALTVKHMGDEFQLNTRKAFIKVLQLGNNFAKLFLELDRSKTISNDWNDIYEIPNNLLQMRNLEKRELIDIAHKEEYPFSGYGIVQALTFKSNHESISDSKFNSLNSKAINIAQKVDKFNEWIPKRLVIDAEILPN
jgi:hypothetical protein